MKLLLNIIACILPALAYSDQPKAVYSDQAEGNGFTIEKSALNPGVVQVVAILPWASTSVGLIIRDADGKFISSCELQIRGNRCSAILAEATITNSSFVTPYTAQTEDEMTELFFGKTKAEQAGTEQPATRPELDSEGGDKPQPESEGRSR